MKKFFTALVALCCTFVLFGCYRAPDLEGVPIKEVTFTKTSYQKATDWEHAQGLTTDGTYFYYAGHNDKTNENADIHIIDKATFRDTDVLYRAGTLHSAELAYNYRTNTLFACSGGDGRKAFVYEIDPKTGALLDQWDFSNVGVRAAGLIAFTDEGDLVNFTSKEDGAIFAFDIITLGKNGAFTVNRSAYFDRTDLGVPQGLEYYDGYIYLLNDAGRTVAKNPHYIYKLRLEEDGSVTVATAYSLNFTEETEGMCFAADGTVYMGAADEGIYVFDKKIWEWD